MRRSTALSLAAATAVTAIGQMASAAVVTQSYVSIQYATNSAFTAGLVTLPATTTAVSIPVGDYFRFGVAELVTGNPNPDSGTSYDMANQANNSVTMPANLGLGGFGYTVTSTDATGGTLTPQVSGTTTNSRAVINNTLTFATSGSGTVALGQVGSPARISGGNLPPSSFANQATTNTLGYFTGAAPTYAFRNLTYLASAAGTVSLTPNLLASSTTVYHETAMGAADGSTDPTYIVLPVGQPIPGTAVTDTANALPALAITILGSPTPTTTAFTLSATVPPGTSAGTLTVTRSAAGGFMPSNTLALPGSTGTFTGIQSAFVQANGFLAGDTEVYGLAVLVNGGTAGTPALTDLANFLNNGNVSGGVVVYRGETTGLPAGITAGQIASAFAGLQQPTESLAFISTGTTGASPEYFSFNLAGFTTDGTFTATAITAVPEPVSIAGLAIGASGLLLARRKRVA